MSGAAQGETATTKAIVNDAKNGETVKDQQKPAATLGEDDEFEDFPVEDWAEEDTEDPGANQHLWEESWDDDDTSEDFAKQLKEELKKVDSSKR
ncbi:MAG: 26S proteasome complex subunit [Bathelium mastoideum]|nr:MAG: 26S proteasome complex subunit [Bathelium mastoideum]